MKSTEMWQLYVPAFVPGERSDEEEIQLADKLMNKIVEQAGGCGSLGPVQGYWKDKPETSVVFQIACSEAAIVEIALAVRECYKQDQVMVVKVSDKVIFV